MSTNSSPPSACLLYLKAPHNEPFYLEAPQHQKQGCPLQKKSGTDKYFSVLLYILNNHFILGKYYK